MKRTELYDYSNKKKKIDHFTVAYELFSGEEINFETSKEMLLCLKESGIRLKHYGLEIIIPKEWVNNEEMFNLCLNYDDFLIHHFDSSLILSHIKGLSYYKQALFLDDHLFPLIQDSVLLVSMKEIVHLNAIKINHALFHYLRHGNESTNAHLIRFSYRGSDLTLELINAFKQNKYVFMGPDASVRFSVDIFLDYPLAWISYAHELKLNTSVVLLIIQRSRMPEHIIVYDTKLIRGIGYDLKNFVIDTYAAEIKICEILYKYNPLFYYGFSPNVRAHFKHSIKESPKDKIKETNGAIIFYHLEYEKMTVDEIMRCLELLDLSSFEFDYTLPVDHETLYKYTWIFPNQPVYKAMPLDIKVKIATIFEKKISIPKFKWTSCFDIYYNFK